MIKRPRAVGQPGSTSGAALGQSARPWLATPAGALTIAVLFAWCVLASSFRLSSPGAWVTWAVSVGGVLAWSLALRHRVLAAAALRRLGPTRPRRLRVLAFWPWFAFVAVVCAWEVLGIDTGPTTPHLTLSALAKSFWAVRAVALLVWLMIGLAYGFVRSRTLHEPGRDQTRPSAEHAVALLGPGVLGARAELLGLLEGNSRALGVGFWLAVLVVGIGIDLVARATGGPIASLGDLFRVLQVRAATRWLALAAWLFSSWHVFAH